MPRGSLIRSYKQYMFTLECDILKHCNNCSFFNQRKSDHDGSSCILWPRNPFLTSLIDFKHESLISNAKQQPAGFLLGGGGSHPYISIP